MMMSELRAVTVVVFWIVLGQAVHAADGDFVCRLTAEQSKVVIGQPLRLMARVTSQRKEAIRAHRLPVSRCEPFLTIEIAEGDGPYRRYRTGLFEGQDISEIEEWEQLGPERPWCLPLVVLYSRSSEGHLALHRPGRYRVRVRVPVVEFPLKKSVAVESEPFAIEVVAPRGVDIEAWKALQTTEFLPIVHRGIRFWDERESRKRAALPLLDILKKYPQSIYLRELKSVLREYFEANLGRHGTAQEENELRQLLDIPPEGPFPDDRRLDKEIVVGFEQETPFAEVLAVYSDLGGVRLTAGPGTPLSRASLRRSRSIRQIMHSLDRYKAEWIKDGDGYRLIATDKPLHAPPPPYADCGESSSGPAIAEVP